MNSRYTYRSAILPQGALVEYTRVGSYVRVAAVDPVSGDEVTLVGDPSAGRTRLAQEAVKKLEYVLRRKRGQAPTDPSNPNNPSNTVRPHSQATPGGAKPGSAKPDPQQKDWPKRAKRPENPSGWDL